jgi:hypothetical protein
MSLVSVLGCGTLFFPIEEQLYYVRQSNDTWILSTVSTMEASLYLATIDCILQRREVYDRINFPSEVSEPPDEV